jgi:GTP-binding protein
LIYYQNEPFLIIDTAGIFRKSKIKTGLEQIGVEKSLEIIRRSDIILMIIDLSEKINHQDKALLDYAIENKKGLIIINNKSDLEKAWQEKFFIGDWAPKILISAKYKKNTEKILPEIKKVAKNYSQRIDDNDLGDFLKQAIVDKKFDQKIWSKIKIKQIGIKPPKFILIAPKIFVKRKSINPAQLNIIEKELRKKWNFSGVPVDIFLRAMERGK